MLIRFLIYGALGLLMEVAFTGAVSLIKKDYTLRATTSLWMFFIYGSVVLAEPLVTWIQPFSWILRGTLYALIIFAVEFATGSALKRGDLCPWDYSDTKYHVHGVIRLDFFPFWFAAGLFFERVVILLR